MRPRDIRWDGMSAGVWGRESSRREAETDRPCLVVESFSAPRASGPSGRSDDVPPALRERPPGARRAGLDPGIIRCGGGGRSAVGLQVPSLGTLQWRGSH